ncbi:MULTISPECIES: rhodanese-like domain-containing protein [unclassified Mannheimia]|uniref:rhodanese-like domain-containing protein n=1 Tax=unclassified Mannheimia TaxID=2645054 RepID=UPI00359D0617
MALSALPFATFSYAEKAQIQQQQTKAAGVWIDVRSAEEFAQGHLENAVNIPHTEISTQITKLNLSKDEPIHVYCRSGRRSEIALDELKKLGYTNVTNQGGYNDLIKKGLK